MKKNIFLGLAIAAILVFGANAAPPSASALTVEEIQAQIKTLVARIAELTKQRDASSGANASLSANANANASIAPMMGQRHRICAILNRNLSQGARGDDVQGLQEFLSAEGYLSANATGYFGPMTANAVARWQASQGVSAVGAVGPMSRERIRVWCGNPRPQVCTMEYAPVCGAKPIVCITTPCNPIQQTYGNRCMMQADGATFLYDGACRNDPANRPPVISGLSGPTSLTLNEQGTWRIDASDPENGNLSYSVTWGDEWAMMGAPRASSADYSVVQSTTFTHSYAYAGTYTVSVVVRDTAGNEARATATVSVSNNLVACTMQYDPVCGQPPEPACRRSIPACMMASPGPQTYGNRCMMNAAGATFLYSGECSRVY